MLDRLGGKDRHSRSLGHRRQVLLSIESPKQCIFLVDGQPGRQCDSPSALPGAGR